MNFNLEVQVMTLGCCWRLIPNLVFAIASNLNSIQELILTLNPN